MSAALLAKLKVKRPPDARETVQVVVPLPNAREAVIVKARFADKRNDGKVDRSKFMGKIRARVVPKDSSPVTQGPKPGSVAPESDGTPIPRKRKQRLRLVERKRSLGEPSSPGLQSLSPVGLSPEDKAMTVKRRRRTKAPIGVVQTGPTTMLQIGDISVSERIGPRGDPIGLRVSSYYMNNREIFVSFMSSLFGPYKEELRREIPKRLPRRIPKSVGSGS